MIAFMNFVKFTHDMTVLIKKPQLENIDLTNLSE